MNKRYAIEGYWKKAIGDSLVIARSSGDSNLPPVFKRHLEEICKPQVNWKSILWRYLVKTPNDFSGYDRRFIHSGLYIEELQGETVEVFCCIDTSGSIGDEELTQFLGELRGILSSYPNLSCKLWYADHDCYGPYTIQSIKKVPTPEGGGGTDFEPFFEEVETIRNKERETVCVYLTDGYGYFPEIIPKLPVLWVVTTRGAEREYFPFGEVTRLIETNQT